ncbi:MAG TPA: acyl-CoA synthetase [Alphaproteobacteria bacterium]|jgi:long-chain acyl-CoA synthetase|nr:acyl-CoA synthetase [Alphaproteobacteria bacterium]MDP6269419.1 acyl-CoA synthetase [Alphaproteobacteria bacterium]HJM51979.1 acyl-CoA synthetase [Alphaproteobacteria bacterium]
MSGRIISGERELAQSELMARVARAAGGLAALGIGADGAVAIVLRNDFAFFEAAMAATLVGAYAVPVNWHFKSDEAGHVIRDCGARAVVIHADLWPAIRDAIPTEVALFVVATPPEIRDAYGLEPAVCRVPEGATDWDAWLAEQEPWDQPPQPARTNMIYTSGTTGLPKGVQREPANEAMAARMGEMVSQVFDIGSNADMRTVITGPVYHSAPNFYALYAAQSGGLVILQPRFDPEELLALVAEHRITHLHMVPTMFVRLLKLPETVKARYDLSSLKFAVHAAAPCPPEVKRRMIEWWGPVINEYYGGTETGAVVFVTSQEALKKPGTVGRPLDFSTVRIYDEAGGVLPTGEIGEVFVWIDGWPDFTYRGLDEKRQEVGRDGLVSCGDIGYLDEDGYLFLCDRSRDMVISGGVNIYPAEIEAVLIDMPGVHDCAVFGIPNEEFGESLCAYVQPEAGRELTADQVRGWLQPKLADYKLPRTIEFASELPREDSGKIFKRRLRDPYWAEAGRSI